MLMVSGLARSRAARLPAWHKAQQPTGHLKQGGQDTARRQGRRRALGPPPPRGPAAGPRAWSRSRRGPSAGSPGAGERAHAPPASPAPALPPPVPVSPGLPSIPQVLAAGRGLLPCAGIHWLKHHSGRHPASRAIPGSSAPELYFTTCRCGVEAGLRCGRGPGAQRELLKVSRWGGGLHMHSEGRSRGELSAALPSWSRSQAPGYLCLCLSLLHAPFSLAAIGSVYTG